MIETRDSHGRIIHPGQTTEERIRRGMSAVNLDVQMFHVATPGRSADENARIAGPYARRYGRDPFFITRAERDRGRKDFVLKALAAYKLGAVAEARKAALALGEYVVSRFVEHIQRGRTKPGTTMPKLEPGTIEHKQRQGYREPSTPLVATGAMLRSIRTKVVSRG